MNDSENRCWQRGDVIAERHVAGGVVRYGFPVWVWSDDGAITVTYLPIGATYQGMVGEDGKPTRALGAARKRVDRIWENHHLLRLIRAGDEYSVLLFFDHNWRTVCWYINLQDPVRRYAHGLETRDLTLDLLIAPDLGSHRWKDKDEFEERIEAGIYEPGELGRLTDVGRGVLRDAAARTWPFDQPWQEWRPPPAWGLPVLPDGWDR